MSKFEPNVIFFYETSCLDDCIFKTTSDKLSFLPRQGDIMELLSTTYIVKSVETVIYDMYKPAYYRVNLEKPVQAYTQCFNLRADVQAEEPVLVAKTS